MVSPEEVRILFEERLKSGIPCPPGEFDPLDLERVKYDRYLLRVIKHCGRNPKKSVNMLWDIMTWRKQVGANQINESNVRLDYIKEGIFFPRGRDVKGCLILIVKAKMHIKGQKNYEELKRVIIYWFDRIEREENGRPVTLFFDMDGCGLSNMDIDLVKYLINLFSSYYPFLLNYIVIYQLPWILSAAVKLVKSLLPAEAVQIMKFPNKNNLSEVVPLDQALTCWGGKDDYVFQFVPEVRKNTEAPKKVTFAEQKDNEYSSGEMLRLQPNDYIVFGAVNEGLTGQFVITNMIECAVSYKIRTTAPEKFRVRPSSGVLAIGDTETIVIVVQPGHDLCTVLKQRFMVVSLEVPKTDLSQRELSDIWKRSPKCKLDEYRLKCLHSVVETPRNETKVISNSEEKSEQSTRLIEELESRIAKMKKQMDTIKTFQIITLFVAVLVLHLTYMMNKKINETFHFVSDIR